MPLQLINGKDLTGWHLLRENAPGWVMENGLLKNQPGSSDLVSDTRFWNSNSSPSTAIASTPTAASGYAGATRSRSTTISGRPPTRAGMARCIAGSHRASTPARSQASGRRCRQPVGRTLTVRLNGRVVLDHVEIVGPTALTMDADESAPGPVVLQGDHGPIEFRRLDLVPLRLDSH